MLKAVSYDDHAAPPGVVGQLWEVVVVVVVGGGGGVGGQEQVMIVARTDPRDVLGALR